MKLTTSLILYHVCCRMVTTAQYASKILQEISPEKVKLGGWAVTSAPIGTTYCAWVSNAVHQKRRPGHVLLAKCHQAIPSSKPKEMADVSFAAL